MTRRRFDPGDPNRSGLNHGGLDHGDLDRRRFLVGGTALGAGALFAASSRATEDPSGDVHPAFPRQDPQLVEEVVRFAHFDLAKVQERVERRPALARAAWDWGFGDWETALGAAAHTGQRKIADYLISKGARPTLFSAAMLGQLDVVRAFVAADPAYLRVDGPHGIPLVAHARAGGEEAEEVLHYLERELEEELEKEPDTEPEDSATEDDEPTTVDRMAYRGTYRFGPGDDQVLHVSERRGVLNIRRADDAPRALHPVSEHVFHPVGAEAVRIVFAVEGGRAVSFTVHDPEPVVVATRE